MRKTWRRIVAAVAGAVIIGTPLHAWAEVPDVSGYCSTYAQVVSNGNGGTYVGGILFYEAEATVTRTSPSTTSSGSTTNTTTTTVGVPNTAQGGGSTSSTSTTTTTQNGTSTSTQEPVGFYQTNDGTVWEINCLTGTAYRVS